VDLNPLGRLVVRLRHLPREARDTLFVLAVIGLVIAPHLLHMPLWCTVMAFAVLGWRARLAVTGGVLPGRWTVTALLVLAAGLTLWGERTILGKEAGVTLLVALMTLKTLELRARRDALVVFFLGFFLVLTHFLYSQSLGAGLWMLLALWGLLTALVLAHMPVGRPPLARAGRTAARAALLGIVPMVVLFVLFPRIGPLWGLPQDAAGRTGLSGSLRLGGIASVADDDSIAFRVRFLGPVPRPDQLYFRGPVLSTFDGREWTRLVPTVPVAQRARAELRLEGEPLRYELTLEPSRLPLLPLLEMTPEPPVADPVLPGWMLTLRPDAQWQSDRPIDERVRLQATAWLQHRHGPPQPVPGLRDLVRLPAGANPRTLAWAAELRARPDLAGAPPAVLAGAVLAHIRRAGFGYTLEPGSYGTHAIDEFWFERKLGFCEHFAAAFVVVLRAMDVPARIVTGYQGADPVSQDGYWIVRQRNAHAWAEYWDQGVGWVRVDPTAAVAPERVQSSRSLRAPPGLVAGALQSIDPGLALRLRGLWETANNRWNQWVLNYARGQQFDLLRALGVAAPDWQDLATLLIAALCCAAIGGALWAWWDRRRQDPWLRLQARVQRRLAALGVAVATHDAPHARAALVRMRLGPAAAPLADALDALGRARYGAAGRLPRGWWRDFDRHAQRLVPHRSGAAAQRQPAGA
jgi:transglutaminase-like putative cysteine protease